MPARPLGNVAARRVREAEELARDGDRALREALRWQDRDPDCAAAHIKDALYCLAQIRVLLMEAQRIGE